MQSQKKMLGTLGGIMFFKSKQITALENKLEEKEQEIKSLQVSLKSVSDNLEDALKKANRIKEEYDIKEAKVLAALEDRHSKELIRMEKQYNDSIVQIERDLTKKNNDEAEKMLKDHYKKLSDSMQKLHEEGNTQTKFMQETTKGLIASFGAPMRETASLPEPIPASSKRKK